jgi:hypothetical protein
LQRRRRHRLVEFEGLGFTRSYTLLHTPFQYARHIRLPSDHRRGGRVVIRIHRHWTSAFNLVPVVNVAGCKIQGHNSRRGQLERGNARQVSHTVLACRSVELVVALASVRCKAAPVSRTLLAFYRWTHCTKQPLWPLFEFGRNILGKSAATYHTVSQLRCYLMPMSLDPREDRGSVESIADLQKAGMPHPEF